MVVLDARIPPWDRRIDAVILSHPHEDHVAGLALLLERYKVGRVFEPGMRGPGPGYAAWLRDLARPAAPVRLGLAAGDHLDVDEIGLRVLWPIRGQVPATPPDGGTGINNVSVVLLGQIGQRRVLLMGDVEEGIDPSLLKDDLPHVDLLKVAHHGSRTATTQAFVDATRPTVAVASAGAGNPYGHPAKATLDRLAASGARVLRTDRDGTVVVGFDAERDDGPGRRRPPDRRHAARPGRAGGRDSRRPPRPPRRVVPVRDPGHRAGPGRRAASRTGTRRLGPDPPARTAGRAATVGYHRGDDGPWAGGCRLPPALPGSPTLVRAARTRRGRGGGLAGGPDRGARGRHRSPPGRGGGPAPRRRQGAPGRRSGARAPARRRVGGVADQGRSSGAGAGRGEPPGDPPARRRAIPSLVGVRDPRGTDRRLRGQACRPAPRNDGGTVRLVASPLSAARCRRPRRRLGGRRPARRPGAGRPARAGRLPRGGHPAGRGPPPGLDRPGTPARPRWRRIGTSGTRR